jgi:hypothetical protein
MCRGQTHRPTTQKKKDQGPPSFPSLFENKKKKGKIFFNANRATKMFEV